MKAIRISSLIPFLVILFFATVGCGNPTHSAAVAAKPLNKATSQSDGSGSQPSAGALTGQKILYKNNTLGITLYQSDEWKQKGIKTDSKGTNLVFGENKIQAIVSIVPSKNSIDSVKKDLLKSVKNPKILSETGNSISFESGTKEKMRISSTFQTNGPHLYIVSFVSPSTQFTQQQPAMKAFMKQLKIN